jgi:predicted peptidase
MQPRIVGFVSFVALSLAAVADLDANDARPGAQIPQSATVTVERDGKEAKIDVRYLLFLPRDHGAQDQKFPLLLFLHGAGERGDDIELVKKHGPPKLVAAKADFPFIVVSPQCPKDQRWNAQELFKLVEHVANTHQVDQRRMYVTGLSMGGSGTWTLLAEYPGTFAAGSPICGRGDPATIEKLAKTPIWAVIGGKDKPELVASYAAIVPAIKAAGGKVKYTLYPDAGHNSWTETYDNPEFYHWLLSHKLP